MQRISLRRKLCSTTHHPPHAQHAQARGSLHDQRCSGFAFQKISVVWQQAHVSKWRPRCPSTTSPGRNETSVSVSKKNLSTCCAVSRCHAGAMPDDIVCVLVDPSRQRTAKPHSRPPAMLTNHAKFINAIEPGPTSRCRRHSCVHFCPRLWRRCHVASVL